ncbi:hypothetical protein [Nocardia sp. NPDC057440]|uniref:hypothetical protein n=1 Tax=Nocardia sp. NPDC057440 TaxID=3346134 RepID=UPI003671110C
MTDNTIAGRPISGTISHYGSTLREQQPLEELISALDAVFAFPEVGSIQWTQYTPYFNDGDACIFSTNDPRIRVRGVGSEEGDNEDGYLTEWDIVYGNDPKYSKTPKYPQVSDELLTALQKLESALESGAHDVKLRQYFGDPAEVTATREGFDVEFYDHE